jgi:hypothetical protein
MVFHDYVGIRKALRAVSRMPVLHGLGPNFFQARIDSSLGVPSAR